MNHDQSFLNAFLPRAEQIFLQPQPRYSWDAIVVGVRVAGSNGGYRSFAAVGTNTFRGFHTLDKTQPGSASIFRGYFLEKRAALLSALERIETPDGLHDLANRVCVELRTRLAANIKPHQLTAYNKLRKPVDLYLAHLAAMAQELDDARATLVPLLSLPLDSQMFSLRPPLDACPVLFADRELADYGLNRQATFSAVQKESAYRGLQAIARERAQRLTAIGERPFHPIYFDLFWNDRYRRWGGNLFETNP